MLERPDRQGIGVSAKKDVFGKVDEQDPPKEVQAHRHRVRPHDARIIALRGPGRCGRPGGTSVTIISPVGRWMIRNSSCWRVGRMALIAFVSPPISPSRSKRPTSSILPIATKVGWS